MTILLSTFEEYASLGFESIINRKVWDAVSDLTFQIQNTIIQKVCSKWLASQWIDIVFL